MCLVLVFMRHQRRWSTVTVQPVRLQPEPRTRLGTMDQLGRVRKVVRGDGE